VRIAKIVRMDTHADQRSTIGTWGWIAIALGTLVVSVPIDFLLLLVHTSTCGQPADAETVLHGRVALLIVLLFAAIPWVIAVPLSRDSSRGALYGLFALFPAALFVLYGFTAGAWTWSLCLGG